MKTFKRKCFLGIAALGFALAAASSQAQLMYGNTFPFWNVNGPLTVTGTTTLSGPVVMSGLVSSLNTDFSGTGVTTAVTDWSLFNTGATTLRIGGAATTVTLGAATGTVTVGPAIIGSIATDSTSSVTGAIKTAGGVGIAKALFVGTTTTTPVLVVSTTGSPAAGDACTAGKIVWDASYLYVCTATGVWKRAAVTGGY